MLSRRRFIQTAAASTMATPAVADAVTHELPELLEARDRLPSLVANWQAAKAFMADCLARFDEMAPALPKALIVPASLEGSGLAMQETDGEGKPVRPRRMVFSADPLAFYLNAADYPAESKTRARLERILATARDFEAKRQAAIEASGIEQAHAQLWDAEAELSDFAFLVSRMTPLSLVGLAIKAECLEALARTGPHGEGAVAAWSGSLRGDIIALAGKEA